MSQVAFLRSGLRDVVQELEGSRSKLLDLKSAVPPTEREEDDRAAEPDPVADMKAVIECGLHDCLEPLIRDLLAASRDAG